MTTDTTKPVEPVVPVVEPVAPVEPVVPAVEAAPATPAEPTKEAPTPEAWTPSGDSVIDTLAKGFLDKGGKLDDFQALLQEVGESGALTDKAKEALRTTFGDMAEAFIPTIEEKAKANLAWVTAERSAVYSASGGEAAFKQMQEWSATNLDAKTREFLSSSLELGGDSAQLAVAQLRELMIKKGATVIGTTHTVTGSEADTSNYISLGEYIAENKKLERSGDVSAQVALKARANASMKQADAQGKRWR